MHVSLIFLFSADVEFELQKTTPNISFFSLNYCFAAVVLIATNEVEYIFLFQQSFSGH